MPLNPLTAGLAPMHPGELLREVTLPALDLPKAEIARRLGISRQTLYDILDEKQPVTAAMALRLAKFFGNTPDFWLNLQQAYDLRILSARMADEIAAIETIKAA
jgi:addiction module HigA family antidote